eukprot:751625-Pelagomonas_calceolata.AAC.4
MCICARKEGGTSKPPTTSPTPPPRPPLMGKDEGLSVGYQGAVKGAVRSRRKAVKSQDQLSSTLGKSQSGAGDAGMYQLASVDLGKGGDGIDQVLSRKDTYKLGSTNVNL